MWTNVNPELRLRKRFPKYRGLIFRILSLLEESVLAMIQSPNSNIRFTFAVVVINSKLCLIFSSKQLAKFDISKPIAFSVDKQRVHRAVHDKIELEVGHRLAYGVVGNDSLCKRSNSTWHETGKVSSPASTTRWLSSPNDGNSTRRIRRI